MKKTLFIVVVLFFGCSFLRAQDGDYDPATASDTLYALGSDTLLWLFVEEDYKEGIYVYEKDIWEFMEHAKILCSKIDTIYAKKFSCKADSIIKTIEFEASNGDLISRIYVTSSPIALHPKYSFWRENSSEAFSCDYVELTTKLGPIPDREDYPESPTFLKKFDHLFSSTNLCGCND